MAKVIIHTYKQKLYLRCERGAVCCRSPSPHSTSVRKIICVLVNCRYEGRILTMSDYNVDRKTGVNVYPAILGGLNLIILIQIGLTSMAVEVGFWDFLFVLAGGYFAIKTVRYMIQAHDSKKTKIRTQELESFPTKGIYSKIRHPVGASFIYLNIACILLFRSFSLITVALIFGAIWFILAKYQDNILIQRFGGEYEEHMKHAGMFRGRGDTSQRLQDSGYGMY